MYQDTKYNFYKLSFFLLVLFSHCLAHTKSISVINNAKLEEQIVFENCNYIISDSIDLRGSTLCIPANCNLIFKANGCFYNGTIIGQLSAIRAKKQCILKSIKVLGSWIHKRVYGEWVGLTEKNFDNISKFKALTALCNGPTLIHLYTGKGLYFTSAISGSAPIVLPSNIYWHNKATIQLLPCVFSKYNLVLISKVYNVQIEGGIFIGDIDGHKGAYGEWGHGIKLGGATNISLKNITCMKFWGDGIDIIEGIDDSGEATINCDKVQIDHVKCLYNRRQGLSIEAGSNIRISNSEFAHTGAISNTDPSSGLVIEPWCNNRDKIWNITIERCNIHDNKGSDFVCLANWLKKNDYFKLFNNIRISNSVIGKVRIYHTNGISINKTKISLMNVRHSKDISVGRSHIVKFLNDGSVRNLKFTDCTGDIEKKNFSIILPISGFVSTIFAFGLYRYYRHCT